MPTKNFPTTTQVCTKIPRIRITGSQSRNGTFPGPGLAKYCHRTNDSWNEPAPTDILQGYLGDCYLLCAISALAEQPSLVKRLFYFPQTNEHGVIGVWLFINGKWQLEIIDEYFPSTNDPRAPKIFAFTRTKENELWVMAIEKAYAKAYGSYFDIVGGCPYWSLRELTGAPFEIIDDMKDRDGIWQKMLDAVANDYVMGCSSISGTHMESRLKEGIATSHAY